MEYFAAPSKNKVNAVHKNVYGTEECHTAWNKQWVEQIQNNHIWVAITHHSYRETKVMERAMII